MTDVISTADINFFVNSLLFRLRRKCQFGIDESCRKQSCDCNFGFGINELIKTDGYNSCQTWKS